jgi:hypothetical protein
MVRSNAEDVFNSDGQENRARNRDDDIYEDVPDMQQVRRVVSLDDGSNRSRGRFSLVGGLLESVFGWG